VSMDTFSTVGLGFYKSIREYIKKLKSENDTKNIQDIVLAVPYTCKEFMERDLGVKINKWGYIEKKLYDINCNIYPSHMVGPNEIAAGVHFNINSRYLFKNLKEAKAFREGSGII